MDRFIKISSEKKTPEKPLHKKYRDQLSVLIKEKKNVFVSGSSGVGKTTLVRDVLECTKYTEIDVYTLKFYNLLENSVSHIFIDDYDFEISSFKKIIEEISEGHKKNDGAFIVVCEKYYLYPNFENLVIEKPTVSELLSIMPLEHRNRYIDAAIRANGNINNFLIYKDFPDSKDVFKTTKEYVSDVLCDLRNFKISDTLQEHGSFWDIIHENYLDSPDSNHVQIINALSIAEHYDTCIYDGDWGAMKFFVNEVIRFTRYYLNTPLDRDKIRPGSCWSKNGNYKMRRQKVANIISKGPVNMSRDSLYLLQKYAARGDIDRLVEYNIVASDFDIINHLCLKNKLKARDVSNIKKALNNVNV